MKNEKKTEGRLEGWKVGKLESWKFGTKERKMAEKIEEAIKYWWKKGWKVSFKKGRYNTR